MLVTSVVQCKLCMELLLFSWWDQPVHYVGIFTIASMRWGLDFCLLYGTAGCPLFRESNIFEVYGVTVRTSRTVRYKMGVH